MRMDTVQQLFLLKQIYDLDSYYDDEEDLHLHRIPAGMSQKDLRVLVECGRSPNAMERPGHDAVLEEFRQLAKKWSVAQASAAFVAGLWSAPFYWRAALTGKLIAAAMPKHSYTPYSSSSPVCAICGFHERAVDTTLAWYRLAHSGTPLDGEPFGHVIALREMARERHRPAPNEYDRWTFRAILTVLRGLPPGTRYAKARDALHREKLLPTKNKWAYGSLLETMGLIGLLDTQEHPGMATTFTTYRQRDERPDVRVEVQAPLAWWDSSCGVNEAVLKNVFSEFDCSSVSLDTRPDPVPPLVETTTGGLEKMRVPRPKAPKTSETAGKGPVQAGDVYAIRIRDGVWVTAYCHEVRAAHVPQARMEYLDGVYDHMPAPEELVLAYRGREDGRWQSWAASMDSTSWVRRIARNIPPPKTSEPEPDRIPGGGAKDLKTLAGWCFPETR